MLLFFARRLILAILVTLTVLTVAFALTRLSGDLAIAIAGPQATQADIEIIEGLTEGEEIIEGPYRTLAKDLKEGDLVEEQKAGGKGPGGAGRKRGG